MTQSASDRPLHIPPRSVVDLSIETMQRLYELKNIAGVKDATGNLAASRCKGTRSAGISSNCRATT